MRLRPRLCAPLRLPARLRAPTCVSFSALWVDLSASISLWLRHVVPVRFLGFLGSLLLALLGFPARLRCLPLFASTRYYACLFCASFALLLHALGYASAWISLAFLLRKALALSFIHTFAFCIIFILSNACAPKTFLYKSYI